MEFIDSYIEALKGEYLFLKEYYEVFKMKHGTMPKNLIDKLFHEEVVQLIKSEQVGEDSYRLLVITEKLEVKLPSILDIEALKGSMPSSATSPSKSSGASPTTPKKPVTSSAPTKPSSSPSSDPCGSSSRSSYGARSC